MAEKSELEKLPYEIFEQISSIISDEDVLDLCQTNKNILGYCNPSFWAQRAKAKGYIKKIDEFGDEKSWPIGRANEMYLKLLSKVRCVPGSEKYVKNWQHTCPYRAGIDGDWRKIEYFREQGGDIAYTIIGAAESGHKKIVEFLVINESYILSDNGNEILIEALKMAATRRHNDISKFLLSKIFELYHYDDDEERLNLLNYILIAAAEGENIELLNYLIEKGADDVDEALNGAAEKGHIDIVKFLIDKGGDINIALYGAAYGGHMKLVKYLINNGGDINRALEALNGAAEKGHIDIVKFLIDKGGDINIALFAAAEGGHLDLVKYLINNGGDINIALEGAAEGDHIKKVEDLINNSL